MGRNKRLLPTLVASLALSGCNSDYFNSPEFQMRQHYKMISRVYESTNPNVLSEREKKVIEEFDVSTIDRLGEIFIERVYLLQSRETGEKRKRNLTPAEIWETELDTRRKVAIYRSVNQIFGNLNHSLNH